MDSSTRVTLVVGAAAGYLVGRSNKQKLAFGLLSLAAGRALDPMSLVGQGIRKLAESPQFEQLSQSLTDALEQRTRSLLAGQDGGEPEGGTPEDGADDEVRAAEASPARPEPGRERRRGREPEPEDENEDEPEDEPEEEDEFAPEPAPEPEDDGTPSARKAGPRNPPAARAKAMGRKARAERAARKPGPKNPPAARAIAKKAADRRNAAERAADRESRARGSGHR